MEIPANTEAETNLIGCILANPRTMVRVIDNLKAEHFVVDAHAEIYRALSSLYQHNRSLSVHNVRDELRHMQALENVERTVGQTFLEDVGLSLATLHRIEDYAENIKRASFYRGLYSAAREMAEMALHQDDNALERAEELITALAMEQDNKPVSPLADVMTRYVEQLAERRKNFENHIAAGVPTGFRELDAILGGLHPSRLYTLAARPSDGKTALSLNIALNIVQHAKHVLFFSLEMDEEELGQRLLAMETPIDQSFLRDGDVNDHEFSEVEFVAKGLGQCDLKIADRTYRLGDIRSQAQREHWKKPLDLIVVDYLQMIDVEGTGKHGERRTEEVARISKGLKRLARELKVPILALAQLNREADKADVPQLSHLGESSGIEKDSDVVMFLHCELLERDKRERNEPYALNVIVRKHRNGARGTVTLRFRPRLTKFEDMEVSGATTA